MSRADNDERELSEQDKEEIFQDLVSLSEYIPSMFNYIVSFFVAGLLNFVGAVHWDLT